MRFVGEHVQPDLANAPVLQRLDQRLFIDDRTASDIDQHAVRSDGVDDVAVDDLIGGRAAGGDGNQDVRGLGHGLQGIEILVRHVAFAAPVIDDFGAKHGQLFRRGQTDAAQAKDADGQTRDRG